MPPFSLTAQTTPKSRQSADDMVGVYLRREYIHRFIHRSGKLSVPVAGPDGTPCEIVQVSAPYGMKITKLDYIRFGLMPLVPGPEGSDPNVVYLGGEVDLENQTGNDGVRKWYRVSGFYYYALLKPVFTASGLPFGVSPSDRDDPKDMVLPPEAFVDTMKPLATAVSAVGPTGLLGGNAGSFPESPGIAPGDDLNRIKKLVPKAPRS